MKSRYLIYPLLITYPLYIIGFNIGYDFSLSVIYLLLVSPFLINTRLKVDSVSNIILAFLSFSFVSYAYNSSSSISSLLALGLFCLILVNKKRFYLEENTIYKILLFGLAINLTYSLLQFAGNYSSIDLFIPDVLSIERYRLSKGWEKFRPIGFFLEPAHLSIYATLILILAKYYVNNYKKYRVLKFLSIIVILISFSLSGAILLAIYLIGEQYERFNNIREYKKNIKYLFSFAVFILLVFIFYQEYFLKMSNRLLKLFYLLTLGDFSGSEGVRGNAFLVAYEYIREVNFINLLIGLGPGSSDLWVSDTFSHIPTLEKGKVPNSFVVIIINQGLIGLILYLSFVYKIIYKNSGSILFYLLFLMINLAYGFYIGYLLWLFLFFIRRLGVKK